MVAIRYHVGEIILMVLLVRTTYDKIKTPGDPGGSRKDNSNAWAARPAGYYHYGATTYQTLLTPWPRATPAFVSLKK